MYSLAELAEKHEDKDLRVRSQSDSLIITRNQEQISLTTETDLRQLFYRSSFSGAQRFSAVGNRWLSPQEEELEETIQKDLTHMIK